jgi:hypothetical protein
MAGKCRGRGKETNSATRPLARFPGTQPFSDNAVKPPISAAATGTGNSPVFQHASPRDAFSYVLTECGLGLERRSNAQKSAADFERFAAVNDGRKMSIASGFLALRLSENVWARAARAMPAVPKLGADRLVNLVLDGECPRGHF